MIRYSVVLLLVIPLIVKAQFNWQVVLPDLIGEVQYHYTSLACHGNKCFIVGNTFNRDTWASQQFFMLSDDGGNTWDSIRFGPSKTLIPLLTKIFALDTLRLYATGDSGYFTKSVDGGKTWDPLRRIWGMNDYFDLYFADSLRGFIVGGAGIILTTFDGGETWNFNRTHHGWYMKNCTGFKSGKYLAFDPWGRMFRSNDFGVTWDTIFAFSPIVNGDFQFFITNIYFSDSLNGFICGSRSPESNWFLPWIIYTSDGGESWTTIIDSSTENVLDLFSICFTSDQKGIAAGRDPKYLITDDGGKTWTTDSINLSVTDWSFIDNVIRISDGIVLATAGDAVSNYLIRGTQKPATVLSVTKQDSKLFPNPVQDKLLFKLSLSTEDRLVIYDITGRQIKAVNPVEREKQEINCSQLPAGMYWLIHNENAYKFIKQ